MKLLKELLTSKDFLDIRIFVIATMIGNLLYFAITQNQYQFSLQLYFVQNFLVPLVCVVLFSGHRKSLSLLIDFWTGVKVAVIVGVITATTSAIITDIGYYILGGRDETAKLLGTNLQPVTIGSFMFTQ